MLLGVMLLASPAVADQVFDLGQKAELPNDKTWRDVLRLVFPDLRQEPRKDGRIGDFIHGNVSIRPIDKEAFEDDCPKEPLRIEYIETARVELSGKMREIVGITTDGDECFGMLALFDGGTNTKLLDAVNIQQDAHYEFGDQFARPLGPDGQLVVADSFHITTSDSPVNNVLVLVTADKLSLIGNVDAQSERDCERQITEDPYVVITPDYGRFDRITGYIKRSVQPLAGDCSTPQGNPAVTITRTDWRWNAAAKAYKRGSP